MLLRSRLRASWNSSRWRLDITFSIFSVFSLSLVHCTSRHSRHSQQCKVLRFNSLECAKMRSFVKLIHHFTFCCIQFKTQFSWFWDDCLDVIHNKAARSGHHYVVKIAHFEFETSGLRSECIIRQNSAELIGSPCCGPSSEYKNLLNFKTVATLYVEWVKLYSSEISLRTASSIVSRLSLLKVFLKSSLTMT